MSLPPKPQHPTTAPRSLRDLRDLRDLCASAPLRLCVEIFPLNPRLQTEN
ncbi:MAG: hypothetical protein NWS16_01650 [Akkermansiaceae bacterium]|nr:hypothetical protein [Akkermansiaceae bacterium]